MTGEGIGNPKKKRKSQATPEKTHAGKEVKGKLTFRGAGT